MNGRRAKLLTRTLAALGLVLVAITVALSVGDRTGDTGDLPFIVLMGLGMMGFAAIGLVIAARAPSNPIGWLYAAVGLCAIIGITADQYATRGLTDLDLPGVGYAAWVSGVVVPLMFSSLLLALLLFPTGSPPSRRWRIAGWLIAGGGILAVVGSGFVPASFDVSTSLTVANPLRIEAIVSWTWVAMGAIASLVAGAVAAFLAVIVRFWRSRGEERQQLRWLAFAVVLMLVSLVAMLTIDSEVIWLFGLATVLLGLPVATAIALLRHRLYDLDVVIKKTVIFGITVVLIMVVGIAVLLIVSGPLTEIAPDETSAVFAAGLVIGVLSWPLWRLARRIGDRLVYGGRSTPYEALTEFSGRLSEAYATDDVLPRMTAILGESTRAAEARVWLRVGASFRPAAAWPATVDPGAPVVGAGDALPDLPGDRTVEVRHRGELLGALSVISKPSDPVGAERVQLMQDLATQAGLVLRNVRLIEELRASRQRLVAAQDE
ncbi:MAG: GAF domain-containing protein, partial [Actinomycetota bacterium]|nr:GAF domain-containing protein [Actinomycetota bacterium]